MNESPARSPLNAREALVAEMLKDVDALLTRQEQVGQTFGAAVSEAVQDAAGKAFLATRMNMEATLKDAGRQLLGDVKQAAALLQDEGARAVRAADQRDTKLRTYVRNLAILGVGVALVAGLLGGYLGASLALHAH